MNNEKLVKRIREGTNRKENLSLLWENNQGLIDSIVHRLTGLQSREEGFEDAKQQAYFGLLEAVDSYNPVSGVKFFSYAKFHIRKALYRYHANCGGLVRVPEHLKNNYVKHMEYQKIYFLKYGKYPDDETCRGALGLSPAAYGILKCAENAMNQMSLDSYMADGEGKQRRLADFVPDVQCMEEVVTGSVYQRELHEALNQAMEILNPEERNLVLLHHYQGRTVLFIARLLGISRQGIYNRLRASYQKILQSEHRTTLESFLDETYNPEKYKHTVLKECVVDNLDEKRKEDVAVMLGESELARVRKIAQITVNGLLEQEVVTTEKNIECPAYSHRREILLDMLEAYRGGLDNSGREFIDFLIERHRRAYEYHKQDEFYRVRHNILVLRYMVSESMGRRDICSRLSIKGSVYDRNLEKGIDELMVHAFGVEGVCWK